MQPNLFKWATSELSQDAFLCWILEWSDPQHSGHEMHQAANKFLKDILKRFKVKFSVQDISAVKVFKQDANIDVWVEIALQNGTKHALLIEDKTGTDHHGNQLKKYLKDLRSRGFSKVFPLYFKIIDASCYEAVIAADYVLYTRSDFLNLFSKASLRPNNQIFSDFYEYLNSLEQRTNAFKSIPVANFTFNGKPDMLPWYGFLSALSKKLESGRWGYVANASGGFMAFYDQVTPEGADNILYVQLDCKKAVLQVRLDVRGKSKDNQKDLQSLWVDELCSEASQYGLVRPKCLRLGNTMAVAETPKLWTEHTVLNNEVSSISSKILKLKKALQAE